MFAALRNLFRLKSTTGPGSLIQLGGRLVDVSKWDPAIIEALRKEYFLPACKDAYLMRVDLSAICPEQHTTTERVGLFTKRGDLTSKISDDLNKIRVKIPCKECGKLAHVTGKHTVWQGDLGNWDGAV